LWPYDIVSILIQQLFNSIAWIIKKLYFGHNPDKPINPGFTTQLILFTALTQWGGQNRLLSLAAEKKFIKSKYRPLRVFGKVRFESAVMPVKQIIIS